MFDIYLNDDNQGEIVIYQSENGDTKINVCFVDETVWLTQQQMQSFSIFPNEHCGTYLAYL